MIHFDTKTELTLNELVHETDHNPDELLPNCQGEGLVHHRALDLSVLLVNTVGCLNNGFTQILSNILWNIICAIKSDNNRGSTLNNLG